MLDDYIRGVVNAEWLTARKENSPEFFDVILLVSEIEILIDKITWASDLLQDGT